MNDVCVGRNKKGLRMNSRAIKTWIAYATLFAAFLPIWMVGVLAEDWSSSPFHLAFYWLLFLFALAILMEDSDRPTLNLFLSLVMYCSVMTGGALLLSSFVDFMTGPDPGSLNSDWLFWCFIASVAHAVFLGVKSAVRLSLEEIGRREEEHQDSIDTLLTQQIEGDYEDLEARLYAIDKIIKRRT